MAPDPVKFPSADVPAKIALVILHAEGARGGAERYTHDLSASLSKRGHDVTLLASSFAEVPAGVSATLMVSTGATRSGRYLRFLKSVEAETASRKYDVVHAMLPVLRCDVYHPHAGIAADAILSGHLKRPAGVSRAISQFGNRFNFRRRGFASVEHRLLTDTLPPLVLCLSEQIKSTVRQHYPNLGEDRLVTLFNSTDLSRFDPTAVPDLRQQTRAHFGQSDNDVVGLMLAQDFERKGLRQSIAALAKISEPRLKLLVAGKQNPDLYRNLASNLGVTDRVRFTGPTDNPAAFYRAADFFVLPTRADPCSLVVLESLAMGVPVISTRANGACEIMTDGAEGRILDDPDNISALVSAMLEMIDSKRRKTMIERCLALRPRLSVEHHLDALEQAYRQIQASKAARGK